MSAERDFRHPLQRARGLGAAKSGTGHWWWQRVTAAALVLLVPWMIGLLVSMVGMNALEMRVAIGRPWNAILLALLVIMLFWHSRLGVQVVIEDYVHARGVEITLQVLNTLACALGALASLYAIGRIALGA